jgi:hypothetical protein
LCPANPRVRDYCAALAEDIARYGCDTLIAEALHYLPLEHGFHHERYFIDIGPVDRMLLGLCFCEHCRTGAERRGVDVAGLHRAVRGRLDSALANSGAYDGTLDTTEAIQSLWDGEMWEYLAARCQSVTEIATLVQDALDGSGTELAVMDPSAAVNVPTVDGSRRDCVRDVSWRFGLDPAPLATVCDQIAILAYSPEPRDVTTDVDRYASAVGDDCGLRVGVSPMPPECSGEADLRAKLEGIAAAGIDSVDFYHYGFMRLETLDVVRAALGDA